MILGKKSKLNQFQCLLMKSDLLVWNMKSALEHCIEAKADRFLVMDNGTVYLQTWGKGTVELIGSDASAYLQVAKNMDSGERKKANELVPLDLRSDWKISVQRQDGYAVWTVYSQKLPTIYAEILDHIEPQTEVPE